MSDETTPPILHYGPGLLQTYTYHTLPTPPSPSPSSPQPPLWLLYLHGGAWRDPLQTSLNILPTLHHLTKKTPPPTNIAGIISLNYRLSPHPLHPTHPSSPTDTQRNIKHPEHMHDLASAIRHVKTTHSMRRWVGVGHSCGATMLCHLVAGIGLESFSDAERGELVEGLEGLVLLEGIYDVPVLLRNHSAARCGEGTAAIYRTFVASAFGEDGEGEGGGVYERVSPTAGEYGRGRWRDGKVIFVAYSETDGLVEGEQRDVLMERLEAEGWTGSGDRVVETKDLQGGHDEIWRDGRQIADLMVEMADRLSG